jgi:acetoin utilization deacetylase AcuC-like enzyme
MPLVWHPDCLSHEPDGEVWLGVWEAGTEVPARASILLDALTEAGAALHQAVRHDDSALTAVHDQALVRHLETVWTEWEAAGYPAEHQRRRVIPYLFPTVGLLSGLPGRTPAALHGRAGMFCYDTMTLVGPGTWEAARGAADAALTAADLILAGSASAYALCRPPGHHSGPDAYGGSCYLNNAAIAAQALRDAGVTRVAILDLDAHHGNGTQAIFYRRADVYFGSVHVDPGAGWFPHYVGFSDEGGAGSGVGANRNLPLAPGTGDAGWLGAVDALCGDVRRHGAEAVVVSLGVDAAASDPESPLEVTPGGYREAGKRVAALGPTVVVQEGGYDLSALGSLTVEALTGFSAAHQPGRTVP